MKFFKTYLVICASLKKKSALSVLFIASSVAMEGLALLALLPVLEKSMDKGGGGIPFQRYLGWVFPQEFLSEGNILYQTGDLDDNGDLRDYWSELDQFGDSDLLSFTSGFLDELGNPTVFPWLAAEHVSNSLSPLFVRTHTLFIPTEEATVGPITIEARLRFRTFAPYLLRALGLGELIEKLEIYDIDEATLAVEVVPAG